LEEGESRTPAVSRKEDSQSLRIILESSFKVKKRDVELHEIEINTQCRFSSGVDGSKFSTGEIKKRETVETAFRRECQSEEKGLGTMSAAEGRRAGFKNSPWEGRNLVKRKYGRKKRCFSTVTAGWWKRKDVRVEAQFRLRAINDNRERTPSPES